MAVTVLYVEDEATTRRVFSIWLEKMGYTAIIATNGCEAWKILQATIPDIILTDLSMPEMDGAELCRRVKLNDNLSHIPVIVLTSHTEVDQQVAGADAGADDYVLKDTNLRILQARMQALLKAQIRRDEVTRREVEDVQQQTLSQAVTTLAHHINNSVMSINSTADVINPQNEEHVKKLREVCKLESHRILLVLKTLKQMTEMRELKSTTYVGNELMFDLNSGLSELEKDSR